jgi:exosortase F-associated protein
VVLLGQNSKILEPGASIIKRVATGLIGVTGLALVFILQQTDVLGLLMHRQLDAEAHFSANRLARIFFNDAFMLMVLYALFRDAKILKLALWIQLIDLFILFPVYLLVKLSLEGDAEISSPFLSQFHRLIVNPTLMILVIPAVYYQKFIHRSH